MTLLTPPTTRLAWTATAFGASFGAYRVYRRPSRGAAVAWSKIAEISVPVGYTPATVEAQHNGFIDYEAGWAIAGAQYGDGWDYAVTVLNAATGIESAVSTIASRQAPAPDTNWWMACNQYPWLRMPLGAVDGMDGGDEKTVKRYKVAGRDELVTRTAIELPAREYNLDVRIFDRLGEDPLRYWRAAASLGQVVGLLGPMGQRVLGVLEAPDFAHLPAGILSFKATLIEVLRSAYAAQYNWPAGLVLNGATQYVTVPDNAIINPGAGDFSVAVMGVFGNSGGSRYAMSKGNIAGAANGYALRSTGVANELQFFVRGAGGNGGPIAGFATPFFDGLPHVALGTYTSGAQVLYYDGASAAVAAVAGGAITNAVALALGADNAGAANWMALAPGQAIVYWPRRLTPAEALSASRYLLGMPGYRMPANPTLLLDLRDARTWPGYGASLVDTSAIPPILNGTVVAAPPTRGIPWPLVELEQF